MNLLHPVEDVGQLTLNPASLGDILVFADGRDARHAQRRMIDDGGRLVLKRVGKCSAWERKSGRGVGGNILTLDPPERETG